MQHNQTVTPEASPKTAVVLKLVHGRKATPPKPTALQLIEKYFNLMHSIDFEAEVTRLEKWDEDMKKQREELHKQVSAVRGAFNVIQAGGVEKAMLEPDRAENLAEYLKNKFND